MDRAADGVVGVVRIDDLWDARRGQLVTPDLRQVTGLGTGRDRQLVADDPAPDPDTGVAGRGRVAHGVEADGAVLSTHARASDKPIRQFKAVARTR